MKELMLNAAEERLNAQARVIGDAADTIREIAQLPIPIDLKVPAGCHVSVWGKRITVTCFDPGVAQQLANDLSICLGVAMEKSFIGESGWHLYRASVGRMTITVSGAPPTSCILRKINRVEQYDCSTYEILCEE